MPQFNIPIPRQTLPIDLSLINELFNYKKTSIKTFIEKFKNYHKTDSYIVAIPSARIGMLAIIKALNLKPNHEIIVPASTHYAVPETIRLAGCKIKYVPVNNSDLLIDPMNLEKSITNKTKAVFIIHLYGNICNYEEILKICKKRNVKVIADCAHCLGGYIKINDEVQKVGTLEDVSVFSFSTGKDLFALGGGILIIKDQGFYKKIFKELQPLNVMTEFKIFKKAILYLRDLILTNKYIFSVSMYPLLMVLSSLSRDLAEMPFREPHKLDLEKLYKNMYRFNKIQALIGSWHLDQIENTINKRLTVSYKIDGMLDSLKNFQVIKQKKYTNQNSRSTRICYPLVVNDAKFIAHKLLQKGIDSRFDYISHVNESKIMSNRILYLPNHPKMSIHDINYMTKHLLILDRKFG